MTQVVLFRNLLAKYGHSALQMLQNLCRPSQELPFFSPVATSQDLEWMNLMLSHVRSHIDLPPSVHVAQAQGRTHRVVTIRPDQLLTEPLLSVVGFFGEVRPGADTIEAIHKADQDLIGEFPSFSGLLTYSSMQLPSGQWGNLAIFLNDTVRDEWGRNERHMGVVKELAARHYRNIRIHHARLTLPLDVAKLEIERTKYYAYENPLVWKAVREGGCPMRRAS